MTTYRVTHVGDSISAMCYPQTEAAPGGVINEPGELYRNLNHSRSVYASGFPMPHSNGSTRTIGLLNASRTEPGGFCVVQDNSLDAAADWHWRTVMTEIVASVPDDVYIVGVIPGWADPDHPYAPVIRTRATIMGQVFMTHPLRRFVQLDDYMLAHPEQFPDGQHPDETARAWIRGEITRWTRP